MHDIHLSQFFTPTQFQDDIIDIDFEARQLEIGDITLAILTVQPNSFLQLNLRF